MACDARESLKRPHSLLIRKSRCCLNGMWCSWEFETKHCRSVWMTIYMSKWHVMLVRVWNWKAACPTADESPCLNGMWCSSEFETLRHHQQYNDQQCLNGMWCSSEFETAVLGARTRRHLASKRDVELVRVWNAGTAMQARVGCQV